MINPLILLPSGGAHPLETRLLHAHDLGHKSQTVDPRDAQHPTPAHDLAPNQPHLLVDARTALRHLKAQNTLLDLARPLQYLSNPPHHPQPPNSITPPSQPSLTPTPAA